VSLSDARVIDLLNRYYIPVFTSNEDYAGAGAAGPEERAELNRIRQEGYAKNLSVGTVHVFVLGPDGSLRDTLHVADARPGVLAALLEKHARALGTRAGAPIVRPAMPPPPRVPPGGMRLHLVARYLEKRGDELVPVTNAGGNWSALPGEDWIVLSAAETRPLLPPPGASVGATWEVAPSLSSRLLSRFCPPTENNDPAKDRLEEQKLTATKTGSGRVRLTGNFRLKHRFYHHDDDKRAAGELAGFVDMAPGERRVREFRLVTVHAGYGNGEQKTPFGVVVSHDPPSPLTRRI
jgi:hypothetical protein